MFLGPLGAWAGPEGRIHLEVKGDGIKLQKAPQMPSFFYTLQERGGASRMSRRPTVGTADLWKPREKRRAIDVKSSLTGSISVWLRQEGGTGLVLRERQLKN